MSSLRDNATEFLVQSLQIANQAINEEELTAIADGQHMEKVGAAFSLCSVNTLAEVLQGAASGISSKELDIKQREDAAFQRALKLICFHRGTHALRHFLYEINPKSEKEEDREEFAIRLAACQRLCAHIRLGNNYVFTGEGQPIHISPKALQFLYNIDVELRKPVTQALGYSLER